MKCQMRHDIHNPMIFDRNTLVQQKYPAPLSNIPRATSLCIKQHVPTNGSKHINKNSTNGKCIRRKRILSEKYYGQLNKNCSPSKEIRNIDTESDLRRIRHYFPQEPFNPCVDFGRRSELNNILSCPPINREGEKNIIDKYHTQHKAFITPDTPNMFNNSTRSKILYDGVTNTNQT